MIRPLDTSKHREEKLRIMKDKNKKKKNESSKKYVT